VIAALAKRGLGDYARVHAAQSDQKSPIVMSVNLAKSSKASTAPVGRVSPASAASPPAVVSFERPAKADTPAPRRGLSSGHSSRWLICSSVTDVLIGSTLALCGILMTPLPLLAVLGTLVGAIVFALLADLLKVPVFHRLQVT
jgi:hypothetical protein